MDQKFIDQIKTGYSVEGANICLGAAKLTGQVYSDAKINIPLKTMTRHGLISGATGTGKTKTVQLVTEKLSAAGVPVLLMDLKGDLSGLAKSGEANEHINKRHQQIGLEYQTCAYPVELLSLSQQPGVRLRATITEFGPILFSKVLGLNETQESILAVIFKYCLDQKLPLLDLKDLKKVIDVISANDNQEFVENYGQIPKQSIGSIRRKIVELEGEGADLFFSEPRFEVNDLLKTDSRGFGQVSILRLLDLQSKPKLFSSFMLNLLTQIYNSFPEIGDVDKPKLVVFIDEAHLLFSKASKALLNQIETIVKLIRSKGVGIYFCTQTPNDIPEAVLGQLGLKIQHALRAFTAKDRKAIKLVAENYPTSEFYNISELITELGIGEAAITALNEKGIPTPLAATLLCAPSSRMGPLQQSEIEHLVNNSILVARYANSVDRDSAYELLNQKLKTVKKEQKDLDKAAKKHGTISESTITAISKNTMVRQMGRTVMREVTRAIMNAIGFGKSGRR